MPPSRQLLANNQDNQDEDQSSPPPAAHLGANITKTRPGKAAPPINATQCDSDGPLVRILK